MDLHNQNTKSINLNYNFQDNTIEIELQKTNDNVIKATIKNPQESIQNLFVNTTRSSLSLATMDKESLIDELSKQLSIPQAPNIEQQYDDNETEEKSYEDTNIVNLNYSSKN